MKKFKWLLIFTITFLICTLPAEAKKSAPTISPDEIKSARLAIMNLRETCGTEYTNAEDYLSRLDAFSKKPVRATSRKSQKQRESFEQLKHEALLANNPLVNFDKILFVKRYTYNSSHFYTDYIDGVGNPGGNLCVLSLKDGKVTDLVPGFSGGIFGRYALSFDAQKVVFDWKRKLGEGFRIYEVGVDGTGLRQLTFPPSDEAERIKNFDNSRWGDTARYYYHHTDDLQPCYLPDGGICFVSSRCEYDILCDGGVFSTTVLYRIDADGGNMEKLTNSAVSESSPTIMPDGRILYTRWEYVDKSSLSAKGLWAIRPDGTSAVEIFGNDIPLPPCFLHGRPVPGNNNMYVCLGAPHFPQSGVGTVIRVDTNKDIRTREPMTYITPTVDIRGGVAGGEGGWDFYDGNKWKGDRNGTSGRLYMDPFPLSESFYMVSCKFESEKRWNDLRAWNLYMLDEFGNHVLIYKDKEYSCWQPMPLLPTKRPPVLNSGRDPKLAEQKLAACVVTDIYRGLENSKPGEIKYIRVNEQVPRPWAVHRNGDEHSYNVARGTHMGLKVQHGIVPVEEDGSAYFLIPADKSIFLQVLDENYLEVQRERTYMNLRPGEVRSCVGCHEKPKDAVTAGFGDAELLALKRAPSLPGPQPGETTGARVIHYATDVQPVWDKHCTSCHGSEDPAAELNLTGGLTEMYNQSYENLLQRRRNLLVNIDEDTLMPTYYLPARSLGSHASRLVSILMEGHEDVKLSKEEMIRVTTWVDSNAQYHGAYWGRKSLDEKDHPNFRRVPLFAEAVSTTAPEYEKTK